MWKPEHRRAAVRHGLRYPSDLTDAEWVLVEPMIPPAKRGGCRREVNVCEVLNAIFYVLSTGCQWQALPKDLPPKSTAHSYFMLWDWDGTLERIHHALYVATREREGREASPTAAILDSQSATAGVFACQHLFISWRSPGPARGSGVGSPCRLGLPSKTSRMTIPAAGIGGDFVFPLLNASSLELPSRPIKTRKYFKMYWPSRPVSGPPQW
jgi:transposase